MQTQIRPTQTQTSPQISPFAIAVGLFFIAMIIAVLCLKPQGSDGLATIIEKQNAVLANNPNNYDALIKRGDAYWGQYNAKKALADYTVAISLRPQSAEAYQRRALTDEALGQYDKAKQDRYAAEMNNGGWDFFHHRY